MGVMRWPGAISLLGGQMRAVAAGLALPPVPAPEVAPHAALFDRCIDGVNRLPRPLMTLGTLALFGYAMADPDGFGRRMVALALMPEPLWWLVGAIVTFYFGAREIHYRRARVPEGADPAAGTPAPAALLPAAAGPRDGDAHGLSPGAGAYLPP